MIELLEDQEVDAELLDVLDVLSRDGFRIALDDFRYEAALEPLLDVAWAVKLDVLALSADELGAHVERLRARDLMLVAEKVETREMYERCRALGFDAFQGYYFTRPAVMRARPAPTRHAGALAGLAAAGATPSFEELERLIAQDAGLCFRLLRFANSAHIGTRHRIGSVRQALTLLGARSVARWATLVILSDTGDHPHQLLVTALTRARLCELLAAGDPAADPDRAFTAGLFSVADALLEAPMEACSPSSRWTTAWPARCCSRAARRDASSRPHWRTSAPTGSARRGTAHAGRRLVGGAGLGRRARGRRRGLSARGPDSVRQAN